MSDLRTQEAWETEHQPFELEWWRGAIAKGHSMDDAEFAAHWSAAREFVKPEGRIIDIGCGPRPAFAPCSAIEPLGHRYQEFTPASWWEGVQLFSQPAELGVPGLAGDTIICWNAIDHAHGWREILDHMVTYATRGGPDAKVAISTDFHPKPFVGHPGFDRDEFMGEVDKRFIITDTRLSGYGAHRAWAGLMQVK